MSTTDPTFEPVGDSEEIPLADAGVDEGDAPLDDEMNAAIDEIELDMVKVAEAERDDYREALQRLQADFENFKKRVARTHADDVARAAGDLVAKLLVVVDTLDLALGHVAGEPDAEGAALIQTRALLLDTLAKEGLERIDAVGIEFDPQIHDAVAHGPAEEGDQGTVVAEVLRAGYRWKGQVLRPAMTRVRG